MQIICTQQKRFKPLHRCNLTSCLVIHLKLQDVFCAYCKALCIARSQRCRDSISIADIACYAKLMTGGVIPLSATLATESVFESFKSDSKLMALLHGHSYSAHAMGCSAAAKAIQWFKDPLRNLNLTTQGTKLRELWDEKLVYELSSYRAVERVVALGTLVAIELCAPQGSDAGYGSVHASSLVRKLREDGIYMRPLGNVVYLMCGPCTNPKVCDGILKKVYKEIDEFRPVMEKELESCEL